MAKKKAAKPEARRPVVTNARTSVRNNQETGTILSGEQKKKLVKQKMREKKARKVPHSAQESIAYQEMFRDGICRVDDRHYTKSIAFGDINYQLAQNEDKTAALEFWCDFYNYFDSSISSPIRRTREPRIISPEDSADAEAFRKADIEIFLEEEYEK